MARIPLPTRETLTDEEEIRRWDRQAERGGMLKIQRAFLTNPGIGLNAFQIWKASGLSNRHREIVILRCAFQRRCAYEWHQHVRIARGEGLTDDDIRAVTDWQDSKAFDAEERRLLAYVDEMATNARPSDASFARVSETRTPGETFGVTFLITLYFQLAHVMVALDLETEEPFVGWALENAG